MISLHELQEISFQCGLSVAGITDLSPKPEAEKRLVAWQEAGYAADMGYMLRPAGQFVDPERLFAGGHSIVSFSLRYSCEPVSRPAGAVGRIARYAWGRDYHRVFKKRFKQLSEKLHSKVPGFEGRFFSDAVPLLEREYARCGGAGFIGRNTLLIKPGLGSFFFLGEMVSNLIVNEVGDFTPAENGCGSCRRCMPACPTGALVSDYQLDSNRCISYLTIEKRGMLDGDEREMIGEWLFGCDICQEVCPFNHASLKREVSADLEVFDAQSGCGPYLDLGELFAIRRDSDFLSRFAGTPLMRARREGLLRNALAVAVNLDYSELIPDIATLLSEDRSEQIRAHALWALATLVGQHESSIRAKSLIEQAGRDVSEVVRSEADRLRHSI